MNHIYFFYDKDKNLLYIGKTTALPKRLSAHFSSSVMEDEPWKTQVDKSNIVTYRCNTKTDLDIYETYLINKLKPIYNEEKVFYDLPTFDLPELTPKTYIFSTRAKTKKLTPTFLEYIDLRDIRADTTEYDLKFPHYPHEYELVMEDKKVLETMNKLPESTRIMFADRLNLSSSYIKFDKSIDRYIWKK